MKTIHEEAQAALSKAHDDMHVMEQLYLIFSFIFFLQSYLFILFYQVT